MEPAMEARAETATEPVKRELHRLFCNIRSDLDRVEILSAALGAFCRPVPDYEPRFRHLRQSELTAYELG
jgi:hypothetical protein